MALFSFLFFPSLFCSTRLTWMRPAAGLRLFSKCFCRCCSWTLRAKPEPRIPCADQWMVNIYRLEGRHRSRSLQQAWTLTAGSAKKATPIILKVAASRRPFHVLGTLSPYPMVVRVIYLRNDGQSLHLGIDNPGWQQRPYQSPPQSISVGLELLVGLLLHGVDQEGGQDQAQEANVPGRDELLQQATATV